jgi:D-glycero-D-manno-heptose 1,7-bisphosphate phosphatase
MKRAVFLDRDGTVNENRKEHVRNWGEFKFLPGALKALDKISNSDYKIILVTNQAVVGRGMIPISTLEEIHAKMMQEIESAGGRIDAIYACTHRPEDGCKCRKPGTLLLELAKETYDLDLKNSWFVGDSTKDELCGKTAGCKTILLATGHGGADGLYDAKPDHTAKDLSGAVTLILGLWADINPSFQEVITSIP